MRNRVYATHTRGFLSKDPLGNIDSEGLFNYVAGDPINLRDPLGLDSEAKKKAGTSVDPDKCIIPRVGVCSDTPTPRPAPEPEANPVKDFVDWLFSGTCDADCQERLERIRERQAAEMERVWSTQKVDPSDGRSPTDPGVAGPSFDVRGGRLVREFSNDPRNPIDVGQSLVGQFLLAFNELLGTVWGGLPSPGTGGSSYWHFPKGYPVLRDTDIQFNPNSRDLVAVFHELMHIFQYFKFGDLEKDLEFGEITRSDYVALKMRNEAEAQWFGQFVGFQAFWSSNGIYFADWIAETWAAVSTTLWFDLPQDNGRGGFATRREKYFQGFTDEANGTIILVP
jgi:hypothetical protein